MRRATTVLAILCGLIRSAQAQHCGTHGIHDPQSFEKRHELEQLRGEGWWQATRLKWKETGREINVPVGGGKFEEGWIFSSPSGNGFLMTGRVMATAAGDAPGSICFFFDRDGALVGEWSLDEVLVGKERKFVGSCGEGKADGTTGCFRYWTIAEAPAFSADGACVELKAVETARIVRFFLPLAMPADDVLTRQMLTLLGGTHAEGIDALVRDLDSDDVEARAKAGAALLSKGIGAIPALEKLAAGAGSAESKGRAEDLLRRLRRWKAFAREHLTRDLSFLGTVLPYPDAGVSSAARARLEALLPEKSLEGLKTPADVRAWIDKHAGGLRWDDAKGRFTPVQK